MKRYALILAALGLVLLMYSPSEAAYRFVLKNGSTIENIDSYAKEGGHYKFYWHGGLIELPQSEVIRIEEYTSTGEAIVVPNRPITNAPVVPKKGPSKPGGLTAEEQARIDEINSNIAKIDAEEKKLKDLESEYDIVKERIENLFTIGRSRAIAAGRTPLQANQQYLQFLTPQERELVQINMIRKGQLDDAVPRAREEFAKMSSERERLLREKQELTARLPQQE